MILSRVFVYNLFMLFQFFKKPVIIISAAAILIIIVFGYFYFKQEAPEYNFIVAKKIDLIQEVSVNGKVKPAESVNLSFEKSGKIAAIYVNVNDDVKTGKILASLENKSVSAQLLQAEANFEYEKAKLDELKRGAREEDIKVKESELKKAEQDLTNYYAGSINKINDVYTSANDAVLIKTVGIFNNSGKFTFSSCDDGSENKASYFKLLSEEKLNSWQNEISVLNSNSSESTLDQAIKNAKNYLAIFEEFLQYVNKTLTTNCSLNNSSLNSYRTNVSAAKTNIVAAIENINDLEQNIASQKITVEKIQNELNFKLAGSSSEEISAQEAKVKSAEANVKNYEAEMAKAFIKSPIDGIITKKDIKIGETVSSNQLVISIISKSNFEIEANVPEADISKIKIGDPAGLTLDAYSNEIIFQAKVIAVEPAETIIEGVPTYKTTLQFIGEDGRIKSGMTADINILTAKKENVIAVPQRAIAIKNNEKFVKVMSSEKEIKEVKVETGLRGSDGNIEIISGINEGDKVIIFVKS